MWPDFTAAWIISSYSRRACRYDVGTVFPDDRWTDTSTYVFNIGRYENKKNNFKDDDAGNRLCRLQQIHFFIQKIFFFLIYLTLKGEFINQIVIFLISVSILCLLLLLMLVVMMWFILITTCCGFGSLPAENSSSSSGSFRGTSELKIWIFLQHWWLFSNTI